MDLFVLTRCVSKNGKCNPGCEIFLNEQLSKEALVREIKRSIEECVETYGVKPNNIEPQKDQGATIVQMYDGTYAWKIKRAETELWPSDRVYVLLHAHNKGYVSYAESRVYSSMDAARVAMGISYESSLGMWRLMQGKTLFKNVNAAIREGDARIQLGGEIEAWLIEERFIPNL